MECRLFGPDADALRAVAHPGDTVPEALRRFITMALLKRQELLAAEERERACQANYQALSEAYQGLVDAYTILIAQLPAVLTAQQETAAAATAVADDCAVVRHAMVTLAREVHTDTVAVVARNAAILDDLEATTRFLNAVVDAWSTKFTAAVAARPR